MHRNGFVALGLSWLLVFGGMSSAVAEHVRYCEQNGVTYRETRKRVQLPTAETRYEKRQETVYHDQYTTQMHDSHHTVLVPVTEYRWETRIHGWWNPFQSPSIAYHLVPRRRWEPRTETVRIPITTHQTIPETRTVHVPVTTLGFVEKEEVSRVAVSPRATTPTSLARRATSPGSQYSATISRGSSSAAGREAVGGITRMESDPPRRGPALPAGAAKTVQR